MRILRTLMLAASLLAFTGGMMTGCTKKGQTAATTPDKAGGQGDGESDDADKAAGTGDVCATPDKQPEGAKDGAKDPDGPW